VAPKLRNRLVHECIEAPDAFAQDLLLAKDYSLMLMKTSNQIQNYAQTKVQATQLPNEL